MVLVNLVFSIATYALDVFRSAPLIIGLKNDISADDDDDSLDVDQGKEVTLDLRGYALN